MIVVREAGPVIDAEVVPPESQPDEVLADGPGTRFEASRSSPTVRAEGLQDLFCGEVVAMLSE